MRTSHELYDDEAKFIVCRSDGRRGCAKTAFDAGQSIRGPNRERSKEISGEGPKTQPFGADAFAASRQTTILWLCAASFFLNSRGTTLMVDPLLEGFDIPFVIDMPILPKQVRI